MKARCKRPRRNVEIAFHFLNSGFQCHKLSPINIMLHFLAVFQPINNLESNQMISMKINLQLNCYQLTQTINLMDLNLILIPMSQPSMSLPSLQALWSARNSTSPIWRSAQHGLPASPRARSAAGRRAPPHRPAERRSQRPWRASPRHPWGKRRSNLRETMGNQGKPWIWWGTSGNQILHQQPQGLKLMYFVWFLDGFVHRSQ